jgi:hypothetical protein
VQVVSPRWLRPWRRSLPGFSTGRVRLMGGVPAEDATTKRPLVMGWPPYIKQLGHYSGYVLEFSRCADIGWMPSASCKRSLTRG